MEPPVLATLQDAILYFSEPVNCREYVVARRWPKGVECPRCGSAHVTFLEKYNRWQCSARHDGRQFTAKTGTIFEDSPLPLAKSPPLPAPAGVFVPKWRAPSQRDA